MAMPLFKRNIADMKKLISAFCASLCIGISTVGCAAATALETATYNLNSVDYLTAAYYGNEAGVGEAVASSRLPRRGVFITTKLHSSHGVQWFTHLSGTK